MAIPIEQARDAAMLIGVALGVATLIKGVIEYIHQGSQKRAEQFIRMRDRLNQDASFKTICNLLDHDDPQLASIPFKDRRDFLGLFEEVALMLNSGIIRPAVAHYMFGYYAIQCNRSRHFWVEINRQSFYWALFNDFVARMELEERSFSYKRRRLRF
jgi:hypothetical protein